jgi:hypothetical protein
MPNQMVIILVTKKVAIILLKIQNTNLVLSVIIKNINTIENVIK